MKRLLSALAALALVTTTAPALAQPNLAWATPTGWAAPLVPRATGDATGIWAPAPTELFGGEVSYINHNSRNFGSLATVPLSDYLSIYMDVDGVYTRGWMWWGTLPTGGNIISWNTDFTAAGGRHTLRITVDATNLLYESNKSDNTYSAQWVWSPVWLANQAARTSPAAPERGSGTCANCDGYEFPGASWGGVGMIPLADGDDYDLSMFQDYADATHGFASPLVTSASGGTITDFVLVNGDVAGYGLARQVGVMRYAAAAAGNYLIQSSLQLGTLHPTSTYGTLVTSGAVAFGGNDVLRIHDVHLEDTGTIYRFTMHRLSGSLDLDLALYASTGSYFGRFDTMASSTVTAPGGDETFTFQPPVAGYYGVVVCRKGAADVGATGSYELRVGRELANLNANVTRAGWASPAVPRASGDATSGSVTLPTTLPGNTAGTWLNWVLAQEGPGVMPAWTTRIYLDETQMLAYSGAGNDNPVQQYYWNNVGPVTIRGGRHSLTHMVDWEGAVWESNESDNYWRAQWLWSPLELTLRAPVVRNAPPEPGLSAFPNCDGAHFAHGSGAAFVSALASQTPGDDYELYLYDDYAGATGGFTNRRGYSTMGGNSTDFVVGHYQAPTHNYPAAVRYSVAGGGNSYVMDQSDASARQIGGGLASYAGIVLGANRLADVYEVYLTAGQDRRVLLTRTAGTSEVRVNIYAATAGGYHGRDEWLVRGTVATPDHCVLVVRPTDASGWYPLVVFRESGVGAGTSVTYNLSVSTLATTGVDDGDGEPLPTTLGFRDAFPNPTAGQTTFAFSLPATARVRLDVYDLRGRRVATLADGDLAPGHHAFVWSGRDASGAQVPSGIFYARLRTPDRVLTQRISVVH